MKKAHAKELAAHVQEHNDKYAQLKIEKMDAEDALREKAKADAKQIRSEAQQ